MHITILMVLTYIACCVRIGTAPWKYFQLNARYFSPARGIFSKLALDELIPEQWRLAQHIDHEALVPARFPVFLKPEWGQNAHGIHRADSYAELEALRARLARQPQRYLLQEAARGEREFEIFTIDRPQTSSGINESAPYLAPSDGAPVITVTEAVNRRESFPINSKYNRHTAYQDVTSQFSTRDLAQLSAYVRRIGRFGIARMSVRANSFNALVAGEFHVIEINLFLPMPINLLDRGYTWSQRLRFIGRAMMSLAEATRTIEPVADPQPIFTRMMLYGRRPSASTAGSAPLESRRSLS